MAVNILNKNLNLINKHFIQYLVQLNTLDFLLQNNVVNGEKYKMIETKLLKNNISKK